MSFRGMVWCGMLLLLGTVYSACSLAIHYETHETVDENETFERRIR